MLIRRRDAQTGAVGSGHCKNHYGSKSWSNEEGRSPWRSERPAAEVETIVLFNPEIPETPESIQVDHHMQTLDQQLAPFPDDRQGKHPRYTSNDAALGVLAVFFTHSPSRLPMAASPSIRPTTAGGGPQDAVSTQMRTGAPRFKASAVHGSRQTSITQSVTTGLKQPLF